MFSGTCYKFKTPVCNVTPQCQCNTTYTLDPHTTPKESEKEASLGKRLKSFPSTLIRRKRSVISTVKPNVYTNRPSKQSFSKTLFKPEEFFFFFRVEGKHFEHGAFRKRWPNNNHVIFLKRQTNMIADCYVFKFPRRDLRETC